MRARSLELNFTYVCVHAWLLPLAISHMEPSSQKPSKFQSRYSLVNYAIISIANLEQYYAELILGVVTLRACTRGKAIGFVCLLLSQKLPDRHI